MQVVGPLERFARERVEERLREAEHAERLRLARTALRAAAPHGPATLAIGAG